MDDDRELRITSGSIIGVLMLLIAMLPRDIRRDFVSRLNEMNLAQEQEERNQVMIASDAPENEDMGHTTTASQGEVLEDPPALESDGELSDCLKRNKSDLGYLNLDSKKEQKVHIALVCHCDNVTEVDWQVVLFSRSG